MKEGYRLARQETVPISPTGSRFYIIRITSMEPLNKSRFKEMEDEYRTIAGDVEGFVRHWGAKRIEELLEYVDDKEFFSILHQLTQLKNNPDVAGILAYYAEDCSLP